MSKSFTIGDKTVTINGDVDRYLNLYKEMASIKDRYLNNLVDVYDSYKDINKVNENIVELYVRTIDDMFMEFSSYFIENGVFDFSPEYLHANSNYNELIAPVLNINEDIKVVLQNLVDFRNNEELRRQMRKEGRFKLQGGGFGIVGAAKGVATAGAFNMATGVAHSIFNFFGDLSTEGEISSAKKKMYNDIRELLKDTFNLSVTRLTLIMMEMLNIRFTTNPVSTNSIMENIIAGRIKDSVLEVALIKAIENNPFDVRPYKIYVQTFWKKEEDISRVAAFFNVNVSDIIKDNHFINELYFKNVDACRNTKKDIENILSTFKLEYNQLISVDYWVKQKDADRVSAIINAIKTLPEVDKELEECEAYRLKLICILEESLPLIKKVNEEEYEKYKLKFDEEFIINKYASQCQSANILFDKQITKEIFQSAAKIYKITASIISRMYCLVLMEDSCIIVTREGFYEFTRFSGNTFTSFSDIKTIEYEKDYGIANIKINDSLWFFDSKVCKDPAVLLLYHFMKDIKEIAIYKHLEEKAERGLDPLDYAFLVEAIYLKKGNIPDKKLFLMTCIKGILLENCPWCQFYLGLAYIENPDLIGHIDKAKAKYWFDMSYAHYKGTTKSNIDKLSEKLEGVIACPKEEIFVGEEFKDSDIQALIANISCDIISIKETCIDESRFIKAVKDLERDLNYETGENYELWNRKGKMQFTAKPDISTVILDIFKDVKVHSIRVREEDILGYYGYFDPEDHSSFSGLTFLTWGIIGLSEPVFFKDIHSIWSSEKSFYVSKKVTGDYITFEFDKKERCLAIMRLLISSLKGSVTFKDKNGNLLITSLHIIDSVIDVNAIGNLPEEYGSVLDYYWWTNMPSKKLTNALKSYGKSADMDPQYIYLLYDSTIFGSADEGIIVHYYGIASSLIKKYILFSETKEIVLGDKDLYVIYNNGTQELFWHFYDRKVAFQFLNILSKMIKCDIQEESNSICPEIYHITLTLSN